MFGAAGEQALESQQRLGHGPALVEFAHQVVARHTHVVEKYLAELVFSRNVANGPNRDAQRLQVHQQKADAGLLLHRLVGPHQHEHVGAIRAPGGPGLLPVDDKMVSIRYRLGAHSGQIGSGIGLRIALRPDMFAGQHLGQKALPLFLCSKPHQDGPNHHQPLVGRSRHSPCLGLLDVGDQFVGRQTHAAVLAWPRGRQPAQP
ncbi:hypothetical protein FQZ97_782600 [compost metagenome]